MLDADCLLYAYIRLSMVLFAYLCLYSAFDGRCLPTLRLYSAFAGRCYLLTLRGGRWEGVGRWGGRWGGGGEGARWGGSGRGGEEGGRRDGVGGCGKGQAGARGPKTDFLGSQVGAT